MSLYTSDYDCMMTIDQMRNTIFGVNEKVAPKSIPQRLAHVSRSHRATSSISEHIRDDPSVLISVFNDPKFIAIVMNCRKQKSPLAYMFVEDGYITCVIKNNDTAPLMVIRLPKSGDNAYASRIGEDMCYTFPIRDISGNRDYKYTKNAEYVMKYVADSGNVKFIYDVSTKGELPRRLTTIVKAENKNVINVLFDTSNSPIYLTRKVSNTDDENNLLLFLNMKIIVLERVIDLSSLIQFAPKTTDVIENYFEIDDVSMRYVSKASVQAQSTTEQPICSHEKAIIWNLERSISADEPNRYMLKPYDTLFKLNYGKLITSNDKLYYMFTAYRNEYMFVKLITSMNIESLTPEVFVNVFSREYQILECYACERVE